MPGKETKKPFVEISKGVLILNDEQGKRWDLDFFEVNKISFYQRDDLTYFTLCVELQQKNGKHFLITDDCEGFFEVSKDLAKKFAEMPYEEIYKLNTNWHPLEFPANE